MRKIITIALACLLCMAIPALALDSVSTGGTSVSPHAEGVCAPNEPIEVVEPELKEEVDVEDAAPETGKAEEPEQSEPEEEPDLTVREMAQANHDGDGSHWYNIEDEDCQGHEWAYSYDGDESFRYCLNCGATEVLELPEEPADSELETDVPAQDAAADEDTADEGGMEIVEPDVEMEAE